MRRVAEFVPASFADLVQRMRLEFVRGQAIFHLARGSWWTPDPNGPDLSVRMNGRVAGTPVGPAAGPHTQLAQNLVLGWLAGGRIFELKTVQINDRLRIGRPCIDMSTVGYNIEWSQELRIEQSLEQYVGGAMLIHMLIHGGLIDGSRITEHAAGTVFDISVGYDLAGIQSPPMRAFIEQLRDATKTVEHLRGQIPRDLACLRDLDYPIRISNSITLSTFHGCPPGEIERICEFLLGEMDCDVVVKMNPTMLGRERLEHLLHDVLGYMDVRVPEHAYESSLRFEEAADISRRLVSMAESRGRRFGVKFSNTLEAQNHGDTFPRGQGTQYLSGRPLHVIALTLADEFRRTVGPEMPFSFSAGVDRHNLPRTVACGFCPVTVCTDLLRPGGYGRLPAYLEDLGADMVRLGARSIDEYVLQVDARNAARTAAPGTAAPAGTGPADAAAAGARNLEGLAAEARADPRYGAGRNRKAPKRVDSQLDVFDCLACEKCVAVCPNAANFLFDTEPETVAFHDWVISGGSLTAGPAHAIAVERAAQIANFADFCNACGNCDTFCPEYGGPFIRKPNFFGSLAAWQVARHDGFFIEPAGVAPSIHGRIKGATYFLTREPHWDGWRFEDGTVCLLLRASDHGVATWFPCGPRDASGHAVDMHAYHTMRILLTSLLRPGRVHQVNVRALAAAKAD